MKQEQGARIAEEIRRLNQKVEVERSSIFEAFYVHIPERFEHLSLSNIDWIEKKNPKLVKALMDFSKDYLEAVGKNGFLLVGPSGSGKTSAMYAMFRDLVKQAHEKELKMLESWKQTSLDVIQKGERPTPWLSGYRNWIKFLTCAAFHNELRAAVGEKKPVEDIIEKYSDWCQVLFLDDLGSTSPTDYFLENLFLLVDSRYAEGLSTVFSSNLTLTEMGKQMGDRIPRRIADMCQPFELI